MKIQLPPQLLSSLNGIPGFDETAFRKVHDSGNQITSIRINPAKWNRTDKPTLSTTDYRLPTSDSVPWSEFGYYLRERPSFTFDPLFHAGCYYVQEASSMFLEQALKQTVDLSKPLKVLDLSAAPGGKSTHIQSLISKNSLLVCNDVIRSRANILKDNIIKWGAHNVIVTNNDPRDFSELENYFDVIVVDAPCSGSGLFRKEPEAINEWSENNVQLCAQRQKRILADAWPALKNDGVLIYSTCSYSIEEDENIIDWLKNDANLSFIHCPLKIDPSWGITETNSGYRFWPDKVKGEGFFLGVFRKKDGEVENLKRRKTKLNTASKKEKELLDRWISGNSFEFIKHENTVYAWPSVLVEDFDYIFNALRVIYSGIRMGELVRDKLIPDHALAMSPYQSPTLPRTNLKLENSIIYLKKKELNCETTQKGWQLMTYEGQPLGWINALSNRINNYYPQEFRILKDI